MLTINHLSDPYAHSRNTVVTAFMQRAVFDSFTLKTLHDSFIECDLPVVQSVLLFPSGVLDVLAWHSLTADNQLIQYAELNNLKDLPVRKRIQTLLMHRFHTMASDREAIRRGLHYLSLPHHLKHSTHLLFQTVDTVWRLSGDTSTDMNYYTKRMILSGVYTVTLPIWLSDTSENLCETASFLENRLDDALKLGKFPAVLPKIENSILSFAKWSGKLRYK